ncbi:hypothetical protein COCOBI_05-2690 [Coccomyxa sp. Obi]|nr:hypothetical protein COCOBI_05-2690 [Coccomyxa sp. Obi]
MLQNGRCSSFGPSVAGPQKSGGRSTAMRHAAGPVGAAAVRTEAFLNRPLMRKSAGPTGLISRCAASMNSAVADAVTGSPSRSAMLVGNNRGTGLR